MNPLLTNHRTSFLTTLPPYLTYHDMMGNGKLLRLTPPSSRRFCLDSPSERVEANILSVRAVFFSIFFFSAANNTQQLVGVRLTATREAYFGSAIFRSIVFPLSVLGSCLWYRGVGMGLSLSPSSSRKKKKVWLCRDFKPSVCHCGVLVFAIRRGVIRGKWVCWLKVSRYGCRLRAITMLWERGVNAVDNDCTNLLFRVFVGELLQMNVIWHLRLLYEIDLNT